MKRVTALLLSLVMALSLVACGNNDTPDPTGSQPPAQGEGPVESLPPAEPVTDEPVYGGEATVYYPKFYNYFDPSMMDEYQYAFWFETLWVLDWGLNDPSTYAFGPGEIPHEYLTGQLAESWVFDETAGTLTVKLRGGVKFHEGEPYNGRELVAGDVEWSYCRLLGVNGYEKIVTEYDWVSALNMLTNVEAVDDQTVVFTFAEGQANTIALTKLMNAKVNIGGPEWDTCAQDWTCAKGTGPYVLVDYVPDNSMTFTRNENYYGVDERHPENKLPYIDTINLVYIADSANVLTQAMSGALDWFGENNKDVLSGDQLAQLSAKDVGTLYPYASGSPAAIALKVCQEPFTDLRVRQAMQLAIDLEAVNGYLGNSGDVVVPGLWSASLSWSTMNEWPEELKAQFTTSSADLAANQEKARALLADAGYPDGFSFDIELDPMSNLELYQIAGDYLQQIGITMNITVAAEMMEAVQHSQDYSLPLQSAGFGGGFGEYMLAFMMTGNGPMPNAYGHDDQEYLAKLDAMGLATSAEEQGELARELDQMFPASHWAILIAGVQPSYDFMADRIGGYSGEKVYYKDNMRTIWSRLWITDAQ